MHSEVYLNKYVVSIAPFSTSAYSDCSQIIQKTALFGMFSLFNFSSIFLGGSADPICPDVRTPMVGANVRGSESRPPSESGARPSVRPPTRTRLAGVPCRQTGLRCRSLIYQRPTGHPARYPRSPGIDARMSGSTLEHSNSRFE